MPTHLSSLAAVSRPTVYDHLTHLAPALLSLARRHGDHEPAGSSRYPLPLHEPAACLGGVELWCSPARTDDGEALLPGVLRIAAVDGGGHVLSVYTVSPAGVLRHASGYVLAELAS